MTANLGTIDRALRLISGVILLVATYVSGWSIFSSVAMVVIATIVGVVLIGTAVVKFCPAYALFGIRTCNR